MNIFTQAKEMVPFSLKWKFWEMAKPVHLLIYRRQLEKYYKLIDLDHIPLFRDIEIETLNRCNGKCTFCPVNVNQPQRKYAKMTEELYRSIIGQLKEIGFKGRISLSSNNEPYLDKRICDFLKYARQELPDAYLWMYTNGTLLNKENIDRTMPYIDYLVVDCYGDGVHIGKKMERIKGYIYKSGYACKVFFSKRKQDEILSSRGGVAPNKCDVKGLKAGCYGPFTKMIIRPDGKVSLCCNDPLGNYTMGDVGKDGVIHVWESEELKKIRRELKKNSRSSCRLCKNCDVFA